MAARTALTYADYAAMPEDGRRYELRDGELSVMPTPGTKHQGFLRDLLVILHEHVKRGSLGVIFPAPVDCVLSDTTVLSRPAYVTFPEKIGVPCRPLSRRAQYRPWMRWDTGPGLPSPIDRPSISTRGMMPPAVLVRNTSSAA